MREASPSLRVVAFGTKMVGLAEVGFVFERARFWGIGFEEVCTKVRGMNKLGERGEGETGVEVTPGAGEDVIRRAGGVNTW